MQLETLGASKPPPRVYIVLNFILATYRVFHRNLIHLIIDISQTVRPIEIII